jgi:site-specific DNA recombinase
MRMLEYCREGKIDRILTKSISRFARNTLDCVKYVRELTSLGVTVYFEKEDIDTGAAYSEILLTVMAAFAQEESRSMSENIKWGYQKRFPARHSKLEAHLWI